jgi:DUF2075 family protein
MDIITKIEEHISIIDAEIILVAVLLQIMALLYMSECFKCGEFHDTNILNEDVKCVKKTKSSPKFPCVKCRNVFTMNTLNKYDGKRCKKCYNSNEIGLKNLTPKIREKVWTKRNKDIREIGKCYTCLHDLDFKNFHMGHIIAARDGGKVVVPNLEAICGGCNYDMGTKNVIQYKNVLGNGDTQSLDIQYGSNTPYETKITIYESDDMDTSDL